VRTKRSAYAFAWDFDAQVGEEVAPGAQVWCVCLACRWPVAGEERCRYVVGAARGRRCLAGCRDERQCCACRAPGVVVRGIPRNACSAVLDRCRGAHQASLLSQLPCAVLGLVAGYLALKQGRLLGLLRVPRDP
jgi:hypothetical protein